MDMEEVRGGAAAQGDLADVVACANATASSSSTAVHHHPPPSPHPAAAAHMSHRYPAAGGPQMMVPNYDDERRRRPMAMSGGGDAVMFEAAPVVDPYLHSNLSAGYGLPTHHHQHQHQLAAVQISSQHGACCGQLEGGLDVDGDDAMMTMRISPPLTTPAAAQHHQMMKRKSEVRKVVCIPAPPPPTSGRAGGGGEAMIPSDLWAWRKYGQKPIKGSPYPRGYYRCSSSKGCLARKQVERSRSDPNMLVITYTAEHNHPWPMQRNVLAGYARAHSTHAAAGAGASSSSASKKHKTDNTVAASSSSNNSSSRHGGYSVVDHPEQAMDAMIGGDQLTVAAVDDGSAGIGVQPAADEVFAELEELLEEPDNSMVNNANKGVSGYEWHKF